MYKVLGGQNWLAFDKRHIRPNLTTTAHTMLSGQVNEEVRGHSQKDVNSFKSSAGVGVQLSIVTGSYGPRSGLENGYDVAVVQLHAHSYERAASYLFF